MRDVTVDKFNLALQQTYRERGYLVVCWYKAFDPGILGRKFSVTINDNGVQEQECDLGQMFATTQRATFVDFEQQQIAIAGILGESYSIASVSDATHNFYRALTD